MLFANRCNVDGTESAVWRINMATSVARLYVYPPDGFNHERGDRRRQTVALTTETASGASRRRCSMSTSGPQDS